MISAQNALLLQSALDGAKQARATVSQRSHDITVAGSKMKPAPGKSGSKGKYNSSSRKSAGAKSKAPSVGSPNQASITPYLTGDQLIGVGNATANAENANSLARNNFMTAAANAVQQSGDVERGRVQGVSSANDDAAARGLYDSGIRQGNVGMANTAAARGQAQLQGGLHMAGATAIQQRNAAKQQLATYLQGVAQQSAENGMALPVDPYSTSATPGQNRPGTPTTTKRRK